MTQYMLSVHDDAADAVPRGRGAAEGLRRRRRVQHEAPGGGRLGVRRRPAPRSRPPPSSTPRRRGARDRRPVSPSPRSTSAASGSSRPPDLDAALKWAEEGSAACAGKVEVRPFQDEPPTSPSRPAIDRRYAQIERIFREEYGRVVASLVRRFGDIDIAEEAAGEALLVAVEKWPVDGVPPNPGGWLTTTAGNKAHRPDPPRVARATPSTQAGRHDRRPTDTPTSRPAPSSDDRLRLIFTCCHPALAPEARVALTLRLLGGLTVAEIAAAFLVPETTMAQRITRAKAQDQGRQHPLPRARARPTCPTGSAPCSPSSTSSSTRATSPASGEAAVRADLTAEAIRLGRMLRELLPRRPRGRRAAGADAADRGPARGPRAPTASWCRSTSRTAAAGTATLIAEGHALVRECLRARTGPGRYQLLAAINAVHTDAADRRGHRLGADRHALRPAVRRGPDAGRRAEPGGRGRRARRAGGGAGRGRPAATLHDVPRLARDPGRPAPPARPQRRGAGGVRRGDRGDRQRRRAGLPDPEAWHAGASDRRSDQGSGQR